MNCSIIRDLLPLYEVGICSDDTKMVIEEHIKNCKECRELFYEMKQSSILEEYMEDINLRCKLNTDSSDSIDLTDNDREFWMKYYKDIYIKVVKVFLIIYIPIILIITFIKR